MYLEPVHALELLRERVKKEKKSKTDSWDPPLTDCIRILLSWAKEFFFTFSSDSEADSTHTSVQ